MKFRSTGTSALNPGSENGPPGALHRGQVQEGCGSQAARPGPTLRSLICFQEKSRPFQVPVGLSKLLSLPCSSEFS